MTSVTPRFFLLQVITPQHHRADALAEMQELEQPVVLVFNKIDQVDAEGVERLRSRYEHAAFTSAQTGEGSADLKKMIVQMVVHG